MVKPRVLLAEDDITMVSLLKTLLKMEGFEAISIQPDDNVIQAMKTHKPNVLILDFHLGSQNGLDVLDEIRKEKETKNIPVIMSSGANVKEECLQHGANDFLMKPYMPDDLISLLKQNISK
ncbi:MAG: response regulator receiver protein [Chloroflexi bacterium OLB14]|nr:MAG: response regulator receiver protein [Chloroflexi bacterium OLB14]